MKKISLLLSVFLFLLIGTAMAGAQKAKSLAGQPSAAKASTVWTHSVKTNWDSFKPETLGGTISMVDAQHNLVVITSHNIPYDFKVNRATKIEIGGSKGTCKNLASQTQKEASVTFIARGDGDYLKSITVTS